MTTTYEVKYSICFETHGYTAYSEMLVDSNDKIYFDDGTERYVESTGDAEKYVEDIYHNQPEDRMVDIPQWIWDDEDNGVGDTCFDIESSRIYSYE